MTYRPATGLAAGLKVVLLVLFCLAGAVQGWGQRQPGSDSTLQAIQRMYDAGLYGTAELEARRYLEKPPPSDSAVVVAEQLIAFSLVAQGKPASAADHFAVILAMDSTYALDPFLTSPKILHAFESAHQQSHRTPGQLTEGEAESGPTGPPPPSFRLLVFPGWDQLHQGRSTKGYVLLSAGVASAGAVIIFDILRRSARDDYLAARSPQDASLLYETYDRYYKAEYYSAAAFVLIYIYSAFDAFLVLPPHFEAGLGNAPSGVAVKVSWSF